MCEMVRIPVGTHSSQSDAWYACNGGSRCNLGVDIGVEIEVFGWVSGAQLVNRRRRASKPARCDDGTRWVRHGFGGGRCGGAAPAQGRPLAADRPYADRVSAPGGDRRRIAEKSG